MRNFLNMVIGGLIGLLLAMLLAAVFGLFTYWMPETLPLWGKVFFYCYIIVSILIGVRVAMEK